MATIVITGRDSDVVHRHKAHAEQKLAKLHKYFDGITKIEAVLAHEATEADVELVISVRKRNPIVCRSQGKTLYAAIDVVLDKAEVQLTKFKERLKDHHRSHRAPAEFPGGDGAAGVVDEEDDLESYDEVVDKTEFPR